VSDPSQKLAAVSAGDVVAFWTRSAFRRAVVERATKHRITVCGHVFTRSGRQIGGGTWDAAGIEPWDEAAHGPRLQRQLLADAQRDVGLRAPLLARHLTAEQTATIRAILDVAETARLAEQLRRDETA
jgi:hypothetical protein